MKYTVEIADPASARRLVTLLHDLANMSPRQHKEFVRDISEQIDRQIPQVYRHLAAEVHLDGTVHALCGKIWQREPGVTSVGKCPECMSAAQSDQAWIA